MLLFSHNYYMGVGGQRKDHYWSIIVERFGSVWIVCQDWIDLNWSTVVERFGLFI